MLNNDFLAFGMLIRPNLLGIFLRKCLKLGTLILMLKWVNLI